MIPGSFGVYYSVAEQEFSHVLDVMEPLSWEARQMLKETLQNQHIKYNVLAYGAMPDYIHWVYVEPRDENEQSIQRDY